VNMLEPGWWSGTMATLGKPPGSMQQFRDQRYSRSQNPLRNTVNHPVIAGWHFAWLGGPDAMRAKVHSFSHAEQAPVVDAYADRLYRERVSPASGGGHLLEVVIDASFPKYMQDRRGPAHWYWPGD
jgi:hypothetical protein